MFLLLWHTGLWGKRLLNLIKPKICGGNRRNTLVWMPAASLFVHPGAWMGTAPVGCSLVKLLNNPTSGSFLSVNTCLGPS